MSRPTTSGRAIAWAVPIAAEAAALGRSIAFAWAIGPDELGRAMMLALTVRLVEMASDLGIDRMLVQAPDGSSRRMQSALHGTAVLRGLIAALAVLGLAPLLGFLLPDGPSPQAYAALAVIPAIRGLAHLDLRRAERRFRYVPLAIVEGGATIAMVISVLPATWLLQDHRAMAAVLVAQAAAFTFLSHLCASRRYELRLCIGMLRRSWWFGAPLILNALLLFVTFYADRLVVARAYDWAALALYGVALQLALLPAQIVGRAAASLVLPVLSRAVSQGNSRAVWNRILGFHALLATGMAAGFALIAPGVIGVVYGGDFRPDAVLALALGLAAGFRVLRTPYSQLAIASGRTGDPARANIVRALALVPAIAFAAAGFPLAAIAVAAAIGEAGATLRAHQLSGHSLSRRRQDEAFA